MTSQQLRIQMVGGGPYGFRLLGGDKNPLSVSKIRPSSKAQVAGLLEGDVILALNDINAQGLSHPTATGLMESNGSGLTVLVLRGKNAISDANSVTTSSSLGPNIRKLTDDESNALAQRRSNQIQTASDNHETNGYSQEGGFQLSAPPSGESLKQIRISRRESQSGDLPTPLIVVEATTTTTPAQAANPNFYKREERTSTDGGKTTRTVEEVKTEKFGGTTLTKVTKQEFTSYSNSSHDQPIYSLLRSEEQGRPVSLGAPSFSEDISKDESHVRDERGWTTTSNVERRSVKTQPYEGYVNVIQEPPSSWVVYQDGVEHGNMPRQGQARNQPIPAIEIHFEPNESGFVEEVKTSGAVQSTPTTDSSFTVRMGNDVSFQPKVHVQSEWSQDQYEFQPTVLSQTYQKPRLEKIQKRVVFSNVNDDQRQPRESYLSDHQSFTTETPKYRDDSSYQTSSDQQLQRSINPDFSHGRANKDTVGPEGQFGQTLPRGNPEFLVKTHSYSRDVESSYKDKVTQSPFSDSSNTKLSARNNPAQNYSQDQHFNDSHSQPGNQKKPPPSGNNPPPTGYYPEAQRQFTATVRLPDETPKYGTDGSGIHNPSSHSAESSYPAGQYNYNRKQEPLYKADQQRFQTDNRAQQNLHDDDTPRIQFGQAAYTEPEARQQTAYNEAPQYRPVVQAQRGFETASKISEGSSHFGHMEPAQSHQAITPQRLPGTKEAQSKPLPWETQVSLPKRADQAYGSPLLRRSESRESASDTYSGSAAKRNIRQLDRVERIEIDTTPKWVPGSKLPIKQAIIPHEFKATSNSNVRSEEEFQRGQLEDDVHAHGHAQSRDDGWYQATAVADGKSLPGVALSRVYDQKKQTNESAHYPFEGNTGENDGEVQRHGGPGYPYTPRESEQSDWPVHGQSGPKNIWRPSNEIQGSTFPRQIGKYDDEWERPVQNSDIATYGHESDARYQPATAPPPPPAPPLFPSMMTGAAPPPSLLAPMFSQPREPQAPPPPVAPPIDLLKAYRGNSSSDKGYGLTTLEERVKKAKTIALSVLAPENNNSRGQKMFLRRLENSHKWSTKGPDPVHVPETMSQRPEPERNYTPSVWGPRTAEQTRPAPPLPPPIPSPQSPTVYQDRGQGRSLESTSSVGSSAYSLTDDMTLNSGKGGLLFAKRRANSEKWRSYESPGSQPAHPPPASSGYGTEAHQTGKKYDVNSVYLTEPRGPGTSSMANQSPSAGTKWQHQSGSAQQPYGQEGQLRGGSSYGGHGSASTGYSSDVPSSPQVQRSIRVQGAQTFSPRPAAAVPPSGQTQPTLYQSTTRFAPQQLGCKGAISQSAGYTDL